MILLYSVILTGCAKEITNHQSDILAEYMAGTVLKNAVGYEQELIYPDEATKDVADSSTDEDKEEIADSQEAHTQTSNNSVQVVEEQSGATVVNNTTTNNNQTDNNQTDHNQIDYNIDYVGLIEELGYNNFDISYSDFDFYEKYPNDNNYYSLETTKAKQLLVLTFDITNLSQKSQNLNLLESNINYQLDNSGLIYNPMITMLMDDIQYINLDFAAKETKKAVIVFEVLKDIDISNTNLIIFYQNKTTIIDIK
jgi:hypothetical protein